MLCLKLHFITDFLTSSKILDSRKVVFAIVHHCHIAHIFKYSISLGPQAPDFTVLIKLIHWKESCIRGRGKNIYSLLFGKRKDETANLKEKNACSLVLFLFSMFSSPS